MENQIAFRCVVLSRPQNIGGGYLGFNAKQFNETKLPSIIIKSTDSKIFNLIKAGSNLSCIGELKDLQGTFVIELKSFQVLKA